MAHPPLPREREGEEVDFFKFIIISNYRSMERRYRILTRITLVGGVIAVAGFVFIGLPAIKRHRYRKVKEEIEQYIQRCDRSNEP